MKPDHQLRMREVTSLTALVLLLSLPANGLWAQSIAELTVAAKKGDAKAQYSLGLAYDQGLGVVENPKEAYNWYNKAARQGHAQAQLALGFCYANGEGIKQDWKDAANWFRKAADQGLNEAMYRLAFCYQKGFGLPKSDKDAFALYLKCAQGGLLDAQYVVGDLYYNGQGVAQSYTDAYEWLRKAANRGMPEAQMRVGYFHLLGQGGKARDNVEAYKWLLIASFQGWGDDPAKLRDKMLSLQKMTPEDVAKSFKLAREFKPEP